MGAADRMEMTPVRKAAVVLLAVGPEHSAAVLKHLGPETVEQVMRELASLGRIDDALQSSIIEEFYHQSLAQQFASEGNLDFAKEALMGAMDPAVADRILGQIQTQVRKTPFNFLQKAESEHVLTFIQDEHPQTIALIVCHLPHHRAAEILSRLPMAKQVEVVKRIANMEQTNPDVIREVEQGLESRLANMLGQSMQKTGGVEAVAEILNLADRATEKTIMEGLESDDPDLVEEIRRLMFVFEDILLVNDKGIQSVLKEIDNDELALALKTASDELKAKILGNMSQRASELIQEDMQYMGPVRLSDVEASQQRIVDVVRRLEEAGELVIEGRGTDAEMVV